MDAMTLDAAILERWQPDRSPGALVRAKTLVIGTGSYGTLVATYVKAGAGDDPAIACIGLDVMNGPPAVVTHSDHGDNVTVLEVRREYVVIGRDLDPPHLSAVLRERAGGDVFRWLLNRQSGGRFIKSVEIGTEGERSYGFLALLWSQREVEELLKQVLKRLNDVRVIDGAGDAVADTPINVIFVGSTAGGVGSAIVLPLCGLVKEAMDRLGIGTHRSLFTYFAVAADAFDETPQQLANSYESLTDIAIAQKEGLTVCSRI
jgi:hypothetical protein